MTNVDSNINTVGSKAQRSGASETAQAPAPHSESSSTKGGEKPKGAGQRPPFEHQHSASSYIISNWPRPAASSTGVNDAGSTVSETKTGQTGDDAAKSSLYTPTGLHRSGSDIPFAG